MRITQRMPSGRNDARERRRLEVERGEDERSPCRHLHRMQPEVGRPEVLGRLHLGSAEQLAGERVGPPVILALQRLAAAAAGRHRTGPVQAHVVVAAQAVRVAHEHHTLAGDLHDDIVARLRKLLGARHELPGAREDPLALELVVDGIDVEPRRNRRRLGQIGVERK
ncbi:MAG: hypothetical protein MUF53_12720, partial [Gemmatimonadaceae bacterium]|nr:hypothetical protein [Gemmatimonadaceae bacterium]